MKKNFVSVDETISTVSATGEGTAVYSNRGGEFVGVVDTDNVFTPLADVLEMIVECIEETEGFKPDSLQATYTDLGAFHGLIIKMEKGE